MSLYLLKIRSGLYYHLKSRQFLLQSPKKMGNQCCVPHPQPQSFNNTITPIDKQPANSNPPAIVKFTYHPISNSNQKIEADGAMIAEGLVLTAAQNVYNRETNAQNNKDLFKVYLGSSGDKEDYYSVEDWRFLDAYKSSSKEKASIFGYALIKIKKNDKKPIKIQQYFQVSLPCQCLLSQSVKDRIKTSQLSPSKSQIKQTSPIKKDKAKGLMKSLYETYQDQQSGNPSNSLIIRHKPDTIPSNSGHPITISNKIISIHLKNNLQSQERLVTMNMIDQLKKWSEELKSPWVFQSHNLCVHQRERAELLKEDTGQAAKALEGLAKEYFQEDNFTVALDNYMKALAIYKKLKMNSSIDKARVLFNIASIYKQQGNYTKTHQYYSLSLQQQKQAKGAESTEVIAILDKIAQVYILQQNYYQAIKTYFQSLRVRQKIYGKESMQAADTLLTIGNLYRTQQKYPKAQEYILQALQITQTLKGKHSLQTAQILYSLGNVSYRRKEYPKSVQIYKQALSIFLRLDHKPKNYAYSQFNLGNTYCKMKEYKLAAQSFEDSIFSFRRQKMEEDVTKGAMKLAKCLKILKQVKRLNQVIAQYKLDPQAL